jgi:hypothetical protein
MRQTMWTALFAATGVIGLIQGAMATPVSVPEPASMSILGLGVGALAIALRARRRKN